MTTLTLTFTFPVATVTTLGLSRVRALAEQGAYGAVDRAYTLHQRREQVRRMAQRGEVEIGGPRDP